MYETILVPVDLSHLEEGSKALEIARQMAGGQARIVALYVEGDIPKFIANQIPEGVRALVPSFHHVQTRWELSPKFVRAIRQRLFSNMQRKSALT